eukprot:COSAG02_NODE_66100_length_256_cov_0.662420_1_plen_29_part_01
MHSSSTITTPHSFVRGVNRLPALQWARTY